MDYCLTQSLKYKSEGLPYVALYYDIMCQYWRNLWKRFEKNPHLNLPNNMDIKRAIGLFHVHGHMDQCFSRYAPTYVPGVGMVAGEILESLWAVFNGACDSARFMTSQSRREYLDDQINDSNMKKLLGIGVFSVAAFPCAFS